MRKHYPLEGSEGQCRVWVNGDRWQLLGTQKFVYGPGGSTPELRFQVGAIGGPSKIEFGARYLGVGYAWVVPTLGLRKSYVLLPFAELAIPPTQITFTTR